MTPTEAFAAATRHHQAGQLAEAERLYAQVLAAEPGHLHALALSGALAHMSGRNEQALDLFGRALAINEQPDFHYNIGLAKWALGRRAEATAHWTRAVALNPNFAQAHMNLGNALREDGRLDEAITHLRRALQLQPSPFAHNNLGLALAARGDSQAAMHYRRAIEMHPQFIEPYLNLAFEYARQGRIAEALASVRGALQINETDDGKTLFVRLAASLDAVGDDPSLRALVIRAATKAWERASDLAPLAATLTKHGSAIESLIRQTDRALGLPELSAIAADPLLRWMLEVGVICDLALERFLTATRASLLQLAETEPESFNDELLGFACGLARQCFINEYVYAVSDDERARAKGLCAAVISSAGTGIEAHLPQIAVVAAYFPLYSLPFADTLLRGSWPAPEAALVDQQIREPRAEADARATIPRLTPIDDDVSRAVQAMYEQNPYPRWITPNPAPRCESLDALMQDEVPKAPYRRTNKGSDIDILIAGCGTGRHSIMVAQQFERARILAIDLSTASLGYAKARTAALGITNIDYGQADILALGSMGRSFDMVQSVGVLHHLADAQGWRVLLSLLRPGGVMLTGLYSESARRDVVAVRDFIKQRGYGSTAEDIRACRTALMAQPEGSPLREVARFNDFFTTSECRDLLFHVQENRTTLPAIKEFREASGMRFLGFQLEPRMLQQYAARFPDDPAMIDLDCWHAFEQDMPYTFAGMYRFWIQKSD
jgi:tetratricopeptide (TPR) repeat protein/SAM-dependent methyltransferase